MRIARQPTHQHASGKVICAFALDREKQSLYFACLGTNGDITIISLFKSLLYYQMLLLLFAKIIHVFI